MNVTVKTSLCVLALFATFIGTVSAEAPPVLRVLNWSGDYIDIDSSVDESKAIVERSPTLRKFMQEYKCTIEYDEYDSEDEMFKKVTTLPKYYDVVITDAIKVLLSAGRLSGISEKAVPNKANIPPKYRSHPADPKGEYFAPYMIGTTGIAYRKDIVGEVTSWKQFFEPDEKLKGKLMAHDTAYMICFAMKYLDIDIHTKDKALIKKAAGLFYNLKKNGFLGEISSEMEQIDAKFLSGELAMGIYYSGEAVSLMEKDKQGRIGYVLPKEGGELYLDCLAVMNDAPNKDLALKYVDFVLRPEINAAIAGYLNYTTPNLKSQTIIRGKYPEYFNNAARIVPAAAMERLEIMSGLNLEEFMRLWRKIKG